MVKKDSTPSQDDAVSRLTDIAAYLLYYLHNLSAQKVNPETKTVTHVQATAHYLRGLKAKNIGTMSGRLLDPDGRLDEQGQPFIQQNLLSFTLQQRLDEQVEEVVKKFKQNNLDAFQDYSIATNMDNIKDTLRQEIAALFLNADGSLKQVYMDVFAYQEGEQFITGVEAIQAQFAGVPMQDKPYFPKATDKEECIQIFASCLMNSYLNNCCESYLLAAVKNRKEVAIQGEHWEIFAVWHMSDSGQRIQLIEALEQTRTFSLPQPDSAPPTRRSASTGSLASANTSAPAQRGRSNSVSSLRSDIADDLRNCAAGASDKASVKPEVPTVATGGLCADPAVASSTETGKKPEAKTVFADFPRPFRSSSIAAAGLMLMGNCINIVAAELLGVNSPIAVFGRTLMDTGFKMLQQSPSPKEEGAKQATPTEKVATLLSGRYSLHAQCQLLRPMIGEVELDHYCSGGLVL